jgi:hypothetical protein
MTTVSSPRSYVTGTLTLTSSASPDAVIQLLGAGSLIGVPTAVITPILEI